MSKQAWVLLIVAAILLAFFGIQASTRLIGLDRDVAEKWARLEPGLARRADAALALAEAVPGAAAVAVAEAAAAWQAARSARDRVHAAVRLDQAVTGLDAAAGNADRVQALRAELREAGARIEVDRRRFEEAVFEYNTGIRRGSMRLVRVFLRLPARHPSLSGASPGTARDQASSPSKSAVDR